MTAVAELKEVFCRYPAGVVIVTTRDSMGDAKGFTASSFTSVSVNPPLVLVCLDVSASCHAVFTAADRFAISILRSHHEDFARRFAQRGATKFDEEHFMDTNDGLPVLRDSLAVLICDKTDGIPQGDHTILVGRVIESSLGDQGEAMVHYRRRLWAVGGETTP